MKITDVTLTLFAWESIPSTIYGHHTARPTGQKRSRPAAVVTDEGIEGHAFLGTSSNPASLDGPGLIRFLKPILIGPEPARPRAAQPAAVGRAPASRRSARSAPVDIALWDIAGKKAGLPIHRLIGTCRDRIGAYASSEIHASREAYVEQARHYQSTGWHAYKIHPPQRWREDIKVCEAVRKAVGDDYHDHAQFDLELPLRGGAQGRPGDPGDGVLLVRGPAARAGHLQLRQAEAEARHPDPRDRIPDRRARFIHAVDHGARHRHAARRRRGQGRHHDPDKDRASRRGLPDELRGPSRRQFAEQRRQPARHHGDPQHRILRGAAARRDAEIRPGGGDHRRQRTAMSMPRPVPASAPRSIST